MKTFNEWATDREDPDDANLVGEQASMMMQRFIGLLHGLSQKQKNEIVRKAINELVQQGDEDIPPDDSDLDMPAAPAPQMSSPFDRLKLSSTVANRAQKANQLMGNRGDDPIKKKVKYAYDAFKAVPWDNPREELAGLTLLARTLRKEIMMAARSGM